MVRFSKAYRKRVADVNRLRGKRSQQVQAEGRLDRAIDADTLRQRALFDRRGATVVSGCLSSEAGRLPFFVCHSTAGRCDQFDVFVDGARIATTRASLVLSILVGFRP